MRAKVYRNTSTKRFGTGKLPISPTSRTLTLIWAGPIFVVVTPR